MKVQPCTRHYDCELYDCSSKYIPLLSFWQAPLIVTPFAGDRRSCVPTGLPLQAACDCSGTMGGNGGSGGGGMRTGGSAGAGGAGGAGGTGVSRVRPRCPAWPAADTASNAAHTMMDIDFMVFSGWLMTELSLAANCGETVSRNHAIVAGCKQMKNLTMTMDWNLLTSTKRLGRESIEGASESRSEYLRDWDRIVYSSAFRRLQDKTQVFPLADSDYVRTRLTHSIEVSSVGRSLGTLCGEFILDKGPVPGMVSQDFGSIVAAACLAHDIGNPPFGHSGEDAIQSWFELHGARFLEALSQSERLDLLKFEGNAQGFRLVTRLQSSINQGGFQLTYAVLAAFAKYPRPSYLPNASKGFVSEKKFGFYTHDADNFHAIATGTGLKKKANGAFARHPLAFLMEAADDICYGIVDLEDGHRLSRVSFDQARALMWPIAFPHGQEAGASYTAIDDNEGRIEYLRARSIGNLIHAVVEVFQSNYDAIMDGAFEHDLASECAFAADLMKISTLSVAEIYTAPTVLQIESAGFEIIGGLLDKFVPALLSPESARSRAHKKLVQIVPRQYASGATDYERLLGATDFISGMTDSSALTLFRRLNGIELPGSSI